MPFDKKQYMSDYMKIYNANRKESQAKYIKTYLPEYRKKHPELYTKSSWKSAGIIADLDAIYNIYINTMNCDYCNKELTKKNRCLDHCHTCGTVRAILCKPCNRCDKIKCYLCD